MTPDQDFKVRAATPSDIYQHMPYMREVASSFDNPRIIELGTRTGNSTIAWLAAIADKGGHLWSADIDAPVVPARWLENPAWTRWQGDDRDPGIVAEIRDATRPGADVLFIDTSHEYQHTMDELDLYMPMLRPGGVALFHDTEWMGCEVAKALDDWCPAHGLEWENRTGCNGLGRCQIPVGCVRIPVKEE